MSRLRLLTVVALAFSMLAVTAAPALAQGGGPRPRPMTWVDGELFNGVVTPATFDPASEPFDQLYARCGMDKFAQGVDLISESKPGDQDYNGGRWHLNTLKTEFCSKYANADRVGNLVLSDFESTDKYFECPLLPRRGNN